MLVQGVIPTTEPLIRIGIVLPEDEQKHLTLRFSDPRQFKTEPELPGFPESHLEINADNALYINGNTFNEISFINRDTTNIKETISLAPVVAGRGFHWQKAITVNLPGNLEISVYEGKLMVINELPLEQYIRCVTAAEMGPSCPAALIEAQIIAARSWLLANMEQKHYPLGFDVCNDDCCQRYQGSQFVTEHSRQSARNTYGQVLLYDKIICDARYSKSCGGMMETFETIWEDIPHPYLQNKLDLPDTIKWNNLPLSDENYMGKWVDSDPPAFCSPKFVPEENLKQYIGSVDEEGHYYRWTFGYSQTQMTDLLNRKLNLQALGIIKINPVNRGGSGRLNRIQIHYLNKNNQQQTHEINTELEIRRSLHPSFLYSSAFVIDHKDYHNEIPARFILRGAGWGHGVGLCQIGALGMALNGYDTESILRHYYPGSQLIRLYS